MLNASCPTSATLNSYSAPKQGDIWLANFDPTVGAEINRTYARVTESRTAEALRSQCVAGVPPVVATGATRREVGAAASAVSVAVASPRASLNFSQGETLRERWKSEFQRYFA
ncbi:hypothetical protein [Nostoc sp.]